jgi:hypothetical protein
MRYDAGFTDLLQQQASTATVDDCERLYRRLVAQVRTNAPDLMGRPFEVSRIYQHLVPYRTMRAALGMVTNDDYELALCQLLGGARGLLSGEREMQEALRTELDSPNPDLSVYRAYATAMVDFTPEPLRDALLRPLTPERVVSVAGSHPSPAAHTALSARPTVEVDPPAQASLHREAAPAPAAAPVSVAPVTASPSPALSHPDMPATRPAPIKVSHGDACRYCGGGLPDGRSVVFCPGCGHNLTVKHCAACATELEVGWKFCITCGRENQ